MKVMRTTVATVVAATLSMSAFSVFAEASLTGAGATFPAPVYAKWADTYQKETGNKVNYQGIGSSGGVKQIGRSVWAVKVTTVSPRSFSVCRVQLVMLNMLTRSRTTWRTPN